MDFLVNENQYSTKDEMNLLKMLEAFQKISEVRDNRRRARA